jgi:hypothetical protein
MPARICKEVGFRLRMMISSPQAKGRQDVGNKSKGRFEP